jgi:hypothetical protein
MTLTPESGFPGTAGSPIQSNFAGGSDAFVVKIMGDTPAICTAAYSMPNAIWAPNHQFVPIIISGITHATNEPVKIVVTGVTQDEPVSEDKGPDAMIEAGLASVRAERSGKGNGRVYQLSFRAEDRKGGFCTGTVAVGVPHSRSVGITAIDDGQVYDSTLLH